MKLTTEQEEAEAAKAAESDASAMDRLMTETLDQTTPPPPEKEEKPPAEPQKTEETKPPAETTPPEPPAGELKPKDTPAEQDEFEKDLESEKYNLPVGATKQAIEVNKLLKQQATERHRAARDAEAARLQLAKENEELRSKMTTAAKDQEDLQRLRPIVETLAIEHDPHFNANFTNRIAGIENTIMQNLVSWGLPKDTAEYIMKSGGPAYFSKDSASQCPPETDEHGNEVRMSHKQFWEDQVVKQLNEERQRSIRLAFDDELRVKEGRDAALRNALANREKYFKDLEEQSKKNEEAFKTQCKNELEAQRKELGELATEREIPKNATEEERKAIEAHNAAIKNASAKFDEYFLDTSPKALIRKNLGGLLLDHMKTLLAEREAKTAAVQARLDELQKKWDASLKAANTSHRQSVQQQPKPLSGIETETNDGARMEKMLEELPA